MNFSNALFTARAIFDEAMFNGVPDFSGATLHADTSFQKLQPFRDIEGPKNQNLEIYQRYHNAFRILRQHMENISDYTAAFMFGRLEQKARRRMPKSMPWWERALSHAYEAFADYGQNAAWPVLWLAAAWLFASIGYSAIAQPNNEIDNGFESAMGLAFANALPPFSYAVSLFFKTEGSKLTEFEKALHESPFLTGSVMTLHTVFAATMVFFLLLALKRRFQIR
ncbi:MAG: hypothetical protein Q9M45_02190 [Robiginitomaculum sp.]|nr:hypothetical protein [Robiginitomaculum sp.]